MVTVSDLQKLPVRVALFCLITHLEMTMADAIRRENVSSAEWIRRLSDPRQGALRKRVNEAKDKDIEMDHLLYTEFCDKVTILRKSSHFRTRKTGFKNDMNAIRDLRDRIAHANDYATESVDVKKLSAVVANIEHWTNFLADWPEPSV